MFEIRGRNSTSAEKFFFNFSRRRFIRKKESKENKNSKKKKNSWINQILTIIQLFRVELKISSEFLQYYNNIIK